MSNGDTGNTEEREVLPGASEKPTFPKRIFFDVKLVDNHYLATFNHDFPRIFHNMQQLLTAIEVESAKLGPGPTQT